MKKRSSVIVYFSVDDPQAPPRHYYLFAKELSKKHSVIFLHLQSLTKINFSLLSSLQLLQTFFSKSKIKLWDQNIIFSKKTLCVYLYIRKVLFRENVVLITNSAEKQYIYKYIPHNYFIFDCFDQYYKNQFYNNRHLMKKFNKICVTNSYLTSILKEFNPNINRVSSGYIAHSKDLALNNTPNARIPNSIVFSGGISHRIDYKLLNTLAKSLPNYHFFFIGEIYLLKYYCDNMKADGNHLVQWKKLLKLKNVHYLGAFDREFSIQLLKMFQVGIIPYKISDFMNYCSNPIKFFEYLQRGLSIVSTAIPSITEYSYLKNICLTNNSIEMNNFIKSVTKDNAKSMKSQKKNIQLITNKESMKTRISQYTKIIDNI